MSALAFGRAAAAESTTGSIAGTVTTASDAPVEGAAIAVASAGGRYSAHSDARGRFRILGIDAGTYAVSADARGYTSTVRQGVVVLPGETQRITFRLSNGLQSIGSVRSRVSAFAVGSTTSSFAVSGAAARAASSANAASGLAAYTAGTVQGTIAGVPGVQQDSFANAILRGGKVDDALFDFDSVPVPQGLIAEPGGNVIGAQLPSTGIATTTVTLAGYQAEGDNALGGIIDQIPAVGTYPGRTTVELTQGIASRNQQLSVSSVWATRDLRWRYAFSATTGSRDFAYGDGRTFYPAEAGTYGLALSRRSGSSASSNVHFRPRPSDDLSVTALVAQASYDQYGTPYPGETYGAFGPSDTFTGGGEPNALVTAPARVRGTLDVVKAQWVHTSPHALARLQLYRSQFGSASGGPYWDDLSFPDGPISLSASQGGRIAGVTYDVENAGDERHHVKYGAGYRTSTSFLDELVPTADEHIRSRPTIFSSLAYLGDTWAISPRLDASATVRFTSAHIVPSDGFIYDVTALDPHVSAVYRIGNDLAARATFDHTTVAPKPLQADRTDSTGTTAFVPLGPETQNALTYTLEGGGRTQFRVTYFAQRERNRIDVLPVNFRSVVNQGQNPSAVGVPTNAGELRASGVDAWVKRDRFTFSATALRGYSSSASQFAFNGLNAAAVAAGHVFPLSYVPDLSATASYEIAAGSRVRVTPSLSYQSGYRYGNGTAVWTFDDAGKPVQVPNDNHVNPGYNYYFLRDPSAPFDSTANPYVATLGTGEGSDPNTLRSPPQTLLSLHVEADVSRRLTAVLDISNVLGTATPTQYQGNPYLIGPPGYAGGDPNYAAWYGAQLGGGSYVLGNGVPTRDGVTAALPWTYGRAAYVPQSYPSARSVELMLRYRL
ncbi:MAG: Carboxypeptidase regulatory-like domain [Candidatus Eremiobacteraeota bacterium]|nr:Carboxypeptidase regulatory-like domain [Candidatus Eremiobacteraeota bacterium]